MSKPTESQKLLTDENKSIIIAPYAYYIHLLESFDPVLLKYSTGEQRNKYITQLQLIKDVIKKKKAEELSPNPLGDNYHENLCSKYLEYAEFDPAETTQETYAAVVGHENSAASSPVKYLGIYAAKELISTNHDFLNNKSARVLDAIGTFNEGRLYWVWGSALLKTVLGVVPASFMNLDQANTTISAPDIYTGYISWTLYYFRLSLNLFLVLKHTLKGPWMSDEEKRNSTNELLKQQLHQRKFQILNDVFWASINLVCFFWLHGGGMKGMAGDALTLALLVADLTLATWNYLEDKALHNKKIAELDEAIKRLEREKSTEEDNAQLEILKKQKQNLLQDWHFKNISLCTNVAYSAALITSFMVLVMPIAKTAAITGLAGASLCFVFTLLAKVVQGGIEISKTNRSLKDTRDRIEICKKNFATLLKQPENELNISEKNQLDAEKKYAYLELKKEQAVSNYQKQMFAYQTVDLIRSIIVEACIPAAIFATLVFFPVCPAIYMLIAAAALALISKAVVSFLMKPEQDLKNTPAFNQNEYDDFCLETKKLSVETPSEPSMLYTPTQLGTQNN